MAARWQLWLKDTTGARVALFDDWISLRITRRINDADEHIFKLNGLDGRIANFVLDAQLEAWREDPAAAIALYLEYEGFHRTTGQQQDQRGQDIFESRGVGYEDLLDRRIVQNFFQSPEANKVAIPAETAMKQYADEQAGPGADIPPGGTRLFEDGRTLGLTIQADAAFGPPWSGSRAYRNLLQVEQDIADAAGMWFAVVGNGPATFEFQAGVLPFGADRTNTGLVAATGLNAAGNRPVIFSNILNTARRPRYSNIRTNEGNRCLALGSGSIDNRNLRHIIPAPDPGLDSPWNNREIKAQAAQESNNAALDDRGTRSLELSKERESFDFEVEQAEPLMYGRDYFLGDTVTAVFNAIQVNRTIVGVTITIEKTGGGLSERIQLQLADVISSAEIGQSPTRNLNRRLSDLESQDFAFASGSGWDNVVTVAKSGGDYTTIAAAHAAITDNVALNRYVIFLMPGLYAENVTMKPYIDIVGIDQRTCRIGSNAAGAAVTGSANAFISNVTIEGGGGATIGLNVGNVANAGARDLFISGFSAAGLQVARGDYENIRVESAAAGSDGLIIPVGGVRPTIRNSYFDVVDRGFDIADDAEIYNCEFRGSINDAIGIDHTQLYMQDCYIHGDNILFDGGGYFVHCFFTREGGAAPTMRFQNASKAYNCSLDFERITITASGCRIYGCVDIRAPFTINIAGAGSTVEIRHCNRIDIDACTLDGNLFIDQCLVQDIAYTGGTHNVRLNGNTYEGILATNANRTYLGNDVITAFFPVTSLGTGTYTLHGTHAVTELDGAGETAYAEVFWPWDLALLLGVFFRVIPTVNGDFDWTVDTTGGADGQDEATHVDTDTADGEVVVDDQLKDVDCSAAFNLFNLDDIIGVEITLDALNLTTAINVLGILVRMIRNS